jgi:hypothetical protein
MPATHAQIARQLVAAKLPPKVFAAAVRDGVINRDFSTLQRMLPGVRFDTRKVGQDEWELVGVCEDGSTVIWRAGA